MSNPSITADKTPWYQWDTGLTVTVSGGEMDECHFANRKQGTAYVQAVINGVARVPDELLQVAAPIKAYGYVSDGAGGQTYVEQTFDVIARNIPADYTYTKTAQKTIRDAEAARDQAVQAAKDAKASELAADDSAVEASNSAQSAGESASAASTSASNAAKSASDAAKSASDAKAAASKTVEDASALLKTYTDNAKTSADNAANSASNAADAASAASDSASAASQSATDASNAKVAAQTAKSEAETAKGEAAASASAAESSATAAEKSASDAAASVGAINVIAPKSVDVAASSEVEGSVAVGAGSVANKENEFSVGNDTLTREITHVSTPTADTSASNKKYTDDNDAKTLNEAKKYTDANTSNALVGSVSGKLLHVDDAWPGKPLGLTIDGAYKQDGTPSPESPVPITLIENPVLRVTGKNQFDGEINKVTGSSVNPIYLSKGTYTISLLSNVDWWSDASNNKTVFIHRTGNVYLTSATFINPAVGKRSTATFTLNEDAQIKVYSYSAWKNDAVSDVQIEQGTVATDYAPYTLQSLPITLPAEHPYLAKLPDGTADTIEVDKDGNVSLVARVSEAVINASKAVDWGNGKAIFNFPQDGKHSTGEYLIGNVVISRVLKAVNASEVYRGTTVGISVGSSFSHPNQCDTVLYLGDGVDVSSVDGTLFYYPLMTPVTYPLGKVTVPSLPDSISNVWTDAELTTDMSMTYKRDINVAFENLVQSVVAAAAGE